MVITKVGFIGLGNMGRPIACNLAQSSIDLQVYDVDPAAMAELVALGAMAADSPAAMAGSCQVICLCVRDDDQVEQVLNGADGILQVASPGLYVLIHSTVSAGAFRRWRQQADERGVMLIDACVTGGAPAAQAQNLCYIVGADAVTLDRIRPVLEPSSCRGGKVVHAGPVGAGMMLKLANNTIAFFGFAAIHEASKMVEASGGSLARLIEVGTANGVVTGQMKAFMDNRSGMLAELSEQEFLERYGPVAKLVEKDLRYAVHSAGELGVQVPCAEFILGAIRRIFLNEY